MSTTDVDGSDFYLSLTDIDDEIGVWLQCRGFSV
jgi:hypothetical protein